ncbi:MAG: phosphoribosylglycinamide formyltransferase [Crocinitomicaceae bacterium]|jgi:phosphoribosylglycinamide formyltransferase-1|nr:phosphoribosylglycinamide formyltransferase [Crocinitomicaceae bacterium]
MLIKRIAIFASGSGTNAENLLHFFSAKSEIEIALLVTNNPVAGVIERVKKFELPIRIISNQEAADADRLIEICEEFRIDYIVLAGYLRMIPPAFISRYSTAIINVHPSLLPKYGGKGMYGMHVHRAVLEDGEKESGISIHFVNEEFDKGEIIAQYRVNIEKASSAEEIAQLVQELEQRHLPETVYKVVKQ